MKRIFDPNAAWPHQQKLFREFVFACRFGLVGVAATAVHMLAVWLLIDGASVPLLLANLIAFLMAFGISFSGNYFWTFGSPGRPKSAMRRFFLIASGAFSINTVLLALLAKNQWLAPALAAVLAATVIPAFTYIASRVWGFKAGLRAN